MTAAHGLYPMYISIIKYMYTKLNNDKLPKNMGKSECVISVLIMEIASIHENPLMFVVLLKLGPMPYYEL